MTKLTASLIKFLMDRYPEEIMLIRLGHIENFTDKMQEEYIEWVQTDEGRSYLVGGANYHDPM